MKKQGKLFFGLLMAITLLLGVFSPVSVFASDGEPVEKDTEVNVTINKLIWEGKAPNPVLNDGVNNPFSDGDPLEGAGFTVYDVTADYHELIKAGKTQDEAAKTIADNAAAYTTIAKSEQTTDVNGQTVFEELALKDAYGKDMVYLFVETSTPTSPTVTKKAAPFVLAMPIYKLAENGSFTDELNTDIQVFPKNETQEDKKEFMNYENFKVVIGDVTYYNITTGDILDFQMSLNVPADLAKVKSYSVTDIPSDYLALLDLGEIVVKHGASILTARDDYDVVKEGNGFTVTLKNTGTDEEPAYTDAVLAAAGETLTITYQMQLTAEIDPDTIQDNTAQVSINGEKQDKIEPTTPNDNPPPKFGTGGKKFVKKDSQSGANLKGAEFVLKNADGTKYAELTQNTAVTAANEYVFVKWVDKLEDATEMISHDPSGQFWVKGLLNGDYALEETKTPSDKYVKIEGDINFEVVHGTYGDVANIQTINNTPKGLLPSTGGTGIAIFLIVGAALMTVAYLWFRKSKKQADV